jgi:gamma-glutamylcyclotransferase (GGCT)/AIG2-like uncharacterized protein YtfP
MTSVAQRSETAAPPEPSRQSRRVRIGLMVAGVHLGVGVATVEPFDGSEVHGILWQISDQDLATLDRAEGVPVRYRRDRMTVQTNDGPAEAWVYVDHRVEPGAPRDGYLERIIDGAQLWLRFVDDTEARKPVIEAVTSAVAAELRKHWKDMKPAFGARVGTAMLAVAVVMVLAVLARWRFGHPDWLVSRRGGSR